MPNSSDKPPIRLLVHGASGRMGGAVLALAAADARFDIVAAVTRDGRAIDRSTPTVAADALPAVPAFDVAIDFSLPPAFPPVLDLCVARGAALVSGTTGLDPAANAAMQAASARIALLWASNFSIGAAVLQLLAERAAGLLGDWDCEIVEAHHRHKRDAPSGTALSIGKAVAAGRGRPFEWEDRIGTQGARQPGSIGIASLRGGEVVGDHALQLYGPDEQLVLTHHASDRRVFARGALRAAQWLAGQPAGSYRMGDALRQENEAPSRS